MGGFGVVYLLFLDVRVCTVNIIWEGFSVVSSLWNWEIKNFSKKKNIWIRIFDLESFLGFLLFFEEGSYLVRLF